MAGRQTADIVFCMDASGSMEHVFDGVRNNVNVMLDSLKSDLQMRWDVRFDFLAYSNGSDDMRLQTVNLDGIDVVKGLYKGFGRQKGLFGFGQGGQQDKFFTSDVDKFKARLGQIRCYSDEANVLALDIAADFPFRDSATCHRVVVMLTDEPVGDGKFVSETNDRVMDVARKYQDRKIALFMVTPPCPVFDQLSQIDRCEWTIDESMSLQGVDFTKLMQTIGKSVSISQTQGGGATEIRPVFGEPSWTASSVRGGEWVEVRTGAGAIQ